MIQEFDRYVVEVFVNNRYYDPLLPVSEDDQVLVRIDPINYADRGVGSVISYSISGISSDDVEEELSGTAYIDEYGRAEVLIQFRPDSTTEGLETLVISFNGDAIGIQVEDTSRTPLPFLDPISIADSPLPFQSMSIALSESFFDGGGKKAHYVDLDFDFAIRSQSTLPNTNSPISTENEFLVIPVTLSGKNLRHPKYDRLGFLQTDSSYTLPSAEFYERYLGVPYDSGVAAGGSGSGTPAVINSDESATYLFEIPLTYEARLAAASGRLTSVVAGLRFEFPSEEQARQVGIEIQREVFYLKSRPPLSINTNYGIGDWGGSLVYSKSKWENIVSLVAVQPVLMEYEGETSFVLFPMREEETQPSDLAIGEHQLTVIADVFGTVFLLKDLTETVSADSHTISYSGVEFNYSEIDGLITTVVRDGEFTEEFAYEISESFPGIGPINYATAVALVGTSQIDDVLLYVANADGSIVG